MKKGQVTIFIIVALLLVVVAGIVFAVTRSSSEDMTNDVPLEEGGNVYNYVENCLVDSAEEAVFDIAAFGGYFFPPENSLDVGIPFYIYSNQDNSLSQERLQKELSDYVALNTLLCVGNFSDFEDYKISSEEIEVFPEIKQEEILFTVDYPLSVKKGEDVFQFKEFDFKIDSRLGILYDFAKDIVSTSVIEGGLCLNCIYDFAEENNLYFDMVNYGDDASIIIVSDANYERGDERALEYAFAVQW